MNRMWCSRDLKRTQYLDLDITGAGEIVACGNCNENENKRFGTWFLVNVEVNVYNKLEC